MNFDQFEKRLLDRSTNPIIVGLLSEANEVVGTIYYNHALHDLFGLVRGEADCRENPLSADPVGTLWELAAPSEWPDGIFDDEHTINIFCKAGDGKPFECRVNSVCLSADKLGRRLVCSIFNPGRNQHDPDSAEMAGITSRNARKTSGSPEHQYQRKKNKGTEVIVQGSIPICLRELDGSHIFSNWYCRKVCRRGRCQMQNAQSVPHAPNLCLPEKWEPGCEDADRTPVSLPTQNSHSKNSPCRNDSAAFDGQRLMT
ncbi:hypothetical protein [Roseobacter sp. S98]|uniref:hypothetical protein n=1 Tax=Roseobacter algicola (ex Choi et al. 2025) (nom. illeg.) TaxID=3092138 RepID=UPI003F513241